MNIDINELKEKSRWLRDKVLDMTVKAGAGHVAPSFSCMEILVSLYYGGGIKFKTDEPKWKDRDRFILSKGQAAVALYALLADLGYFPVSELDLFTQPGSFLGGHAEDNIPGVEAFTGSLGHGLSIASGIALGAKMKKENYDVITLLGDGECHEGSVWEAAMFSSFHKLSNMLAIIDNNGLSATNHISEYLDLEPLEEKWKAFGWNTVIVSGHSFEELIKEIKNFKESNHEKPMVIIAKTIKGRGVSFMESQPIWHYRIPVGEELKKAKEELADTLID